MTTLISDLQETFLDAVRRNNYEKVQRMVNSGAIDVNYSTGVQTIPLLEAARAGHVETIEILLDNGANLALRDEGSEWTALMYATSENHVPCVEQLLHRGASMEALATEGTVLHIAAYHGFVDVVRLLLDHGANERIRDSQGRSAQEVAQASGKGDAASLIADYGRELAYDPMFVDPDDVATMDATGRIAAAEGDLADTRERLWQLGALSDTVASQFADPEAWRAMRACLSSSTATCFTYTERLGRRRHNPSQRGDPAFYGSCAAAYSVEPRAGADVPLCVKVMFNLDDGADQGTADMMAKFRAEWEILSDEERLPWHPNVMRIYHQFSGNVREMGLPDYDAPDANPRTVCMVMPRLETNLGSLISRRLEAFDTNPPTRDTIFSAAEFFYYGLQLCLAVAHLHRHRIVHRDLYPANVLLGGEHIHAARDGVLAMPQQLLVSDFGCCLDATRDTLLGTFHLQYVSRHVDRGGNASYLAPEVMRAAPGPGAIIDYDKNDVFAAGRCLYAMVSSRDLLAGCGGATHAYTDAHFTPPNGFREPTAAAADDHVTAALRAMLRAEPTDRCSADEAVQMMARGHRAHPLE